MNRGEYPNHRLQALIETKKSERKKVWNFISKVWILFQKQTMNHFATEISEIRNQKQIFIARWLAIKNIRTVT